MGSSEIAELTGEKLRETELVFSACIGIMMMRLRERAGFTDRQVAAILHIPYEEFCEFEAGQVAISLARIQILSVLYGCGVAEFCEFNPWPGPG